jgi:hypothetical protein
MSNDTPEQPTLKQKYNRWMYDEQPASRGPTSSGQPTVVGDQPKPVQPPLPSGEPTPFNYVHMPPAKGMPTWVKAILGLGAAGVAIAIAVNSGTANNSIDVGDCVHESGWTGASCSDSDAWRLDNKTDDPQSCPGIEGAPVAFQDPDTKQWFCASKVNS